MANEDLDRMNADYEKIKKDCDALKYYRGKSMAAEKALKESRGFTSVEYKENCLKEKETNDKAYKDLIEECLSKYNVQTSFAIAYKMKELEKSIRELEAREQERPQVPEEAKTQQASESQNQAPSQAELEKEFDKQLKQSFQEVSQPQIAEPSRQVSNHDGQEKQVSHVHHERTVSRFQERYRIAEKYGNEQNHGKDHDPTP